MHRGIGDDNLFLPEPLAQKGKVDDPAKVDSLAITPTSNDLDVAQQTLTCSSQTTNPLITRDEPRHPEYNRVKNVPSGANDLVTQAHFGPQSQLTKPRLNPQRHAHETSTKIKNSALLDLSTFHVQSTKPRSSAPSPSLRRQHPTHATRIYTLRSGEGNQHASSPGYRSRRAPGTATEGHAASKRPSRNIVRAGKR
jgi:hypothetical protein